MKSVLVSFFPSLLPLLLMLAMICLPLSLRAQNQEDANGEIKLSDSFRQALEGAFLFNPITSEPLPYPNPLTREQLHEWVGPVDTTDVAIQMELWRRRHPQDLTDENLPQDSAQSQYMETYRQLRLWEKNFKPLPPTAVIEIKIPGLTDHVQWRSKNGRYSVIRTPDGRSALSGLDVNALGKYIRPKEIRLRKSRARAKKNKGEMDLYYPIIPNPE